MIKKLSNIVWHPVLLAAFSVLAMFAYNLGEVVFSVVIRPLVLAVLLALVVLFVFWLILRNWDKAGVLAAWTLVMFFTYGHVYNILKANGLDHSIGRHRFLLPIWGLVFVLVLILLLRKLSDARPFTQILNVVALTLLVFSLFSVGRYYFWKLRAQSTYAVDSDASELGLTPPKNPPDIYYILLDGYTRADVLQDSFDFDNSAFIEDLEALGFDVLDCSRSNYTHTQLTLPTMLNLAYLDELVGEIENKAVMESVPLSDLTLNNQVMTALQSLGYETVAFETGYYWSHFYEADYYFEPTRQALATTPLTEFEELYLDTTLLSVALDWQRYLSVTAIQAPTMPREAHYIRVNFALETLKTLPELEGPQFVFAHLVIPHKPYIFNEDGLIPDLNLYSDALESGEAGRAGYLNNIRFINPRILEVVRTILRDSSTDPIIIIQSDHGSDFIDRTANFAAFYLPGEGEAMPYESLTPVNTFRLIFDAYFDANLPLLPDRSYTNTTDLFYDFEEVEEDYPPCQTLP